MTFKNWVRDVYLTIRYGKWYAVRKLEIDPDASISQIAAIKCEGTRVMYDPGTKYVWYAVCRRTNEEIAQDSKRKAEGFVAYWNDVRGEDLL